MKVAAMANNQGNTIGGRKRTRSARYIAMRDKRVAREIYVGDNKVTNATTACPDDKSTNNNNVVSSRPMTRKEL